MACGNYIWSLDNSEILQGVSIPAIKSFILEKYPTVDPAMLKHRLKKAIEKAMVGELITRPKSSDQMGNFNADWQNGQP